MIARWRNPSNISSTFSGRNSPSCWVAPRLTMSSLKRQGFAKSQHHWSLHAASNDWSRLEAYQQSKRRINHWAINHLITRSCHFCIVAKIVHKINVISALSRTNSRYIFIPITLWEIKWPLSTRIISSRLWWSPPVMSRTNPPASINSWCIPMA